MYSRAAGCYVCVCVFTRFGFACKIIDLVFKGNDCTKSAAQITSPPSKK